MIPLIRARPGIRIPELASIFGVRDAEIWEDITEILTLCGVPPYLPHNYLIFAIHGDRVSIRFAEHLARPVHLTLQEALAIDLALRSVSGGRPPAFGDAAPRLRKKLRDVLAGPERAMLETLDRQVGGAAPSDHVSETIQVLKTAMSRNVAVEIEYYTASRDSVGVRVIEPYGLIDHRGNWYVVARDVLRDRQVPFRVDRIRWTRPVPGQEYEVPEDFTTEAFRRDEMRERAPGDVAVKVRFAARLAARVREDAGPRLVQALPDGSILRTYYIDPARPRWVYTHVARYGAEAEIVSPPDVRAGMARFLDEVIAAQSVAVQPPRRTARAAATTPRKRPRARRKPRSG
jgi:proteasome accessory factor C